MICYKIVKNNGSRRKSLCSGRTSKTYRVTKRNYPDKNCGPLCCFESIAYIGQVLHNILFKGEELWRVKIKKSRHNKIWHVKESNGEKLKKDMLFKGTVLADWVDFLCKLN